MKKLIDISEMTEINPSSLLAGCILILFALMIIAAVFMALVYYLGWWLVVGVLLLSLPWSCVIIYRDCMRGDVR